MTRRSRKLLILLDRGTENAEVGLSAALSPYAWLLIFGRILQGVGCSMVLSTSVAILTSVFPPGERGKILGLNAAVAYLAQSAGPLLGGFLTQTFGWRGVFMSVVPLGLSIAGFVAFGLRGVEWIEAREQSLDLAGTGLYCLAFIATMLGFSFLPSTAAWGLILAGFAGFGAFLIQERRTSHPLLDLGLFLRNRLFTLSNLAALINYSATHGISFLLSLYLQHLRGLAPNETGLILAAQPLMQMLFSPITGRISDRFDPRTLSTLGMLVITAGVFSLIFLTMRTPIILILVALAGLGMGFALFVAPNTNTIMGAVDKQLYGVASGVLNTMRITGQVFSMGIITIVFAAHLKTNALTASNSSELLVCERIIFGLMTVVCLGSVYACRSHSSVVSHGAGGPSN